MCLTNVIAFIGVLGFLRFVWWIGKVLYGKFAKPKDLKKEGYKWVLITGATSGTGYALAEKVAAQGVNVIATGRNVDQLNALEKSCKSKKVEFVKIAQDLGEEGAVEKIFEAIGNRKVDAMFVCHGLGPMRRAQNFTNKEIVDYNNAMVISNVLLAKYFKERGNPNGTITYMSSANTFMYTPFAQNYGTVKRWLNQFVHMYKLESEGITVQVINPGHINGTSFFKNIPECMKSMTKDTPSALTPGRVADVILATIKTNLDIDVGNDAVMMRILYTVVPTPLMDMVMKNMAKGLNL